LRAGGIGDRCSNAVSDDVDGDHTVRFFTGLHKMSHVVSQVVDFSLVAFHWDLRSICHDAGIGDVFYIYRALQTRAMTC
jgi:hypothetical protein